MADDTDLLLRLYQEEWSLIRHYEEQRTTVTNFVLIIASVAIGVIVQKGVTVDLFPVAILLVVLGIYGAASVTKLYELSQYANTLQRYFANRLDEVHPDARIRQLISEARAEHKARFPRISRLHMNHLWLVLHAAIALSGIWLAVMVIA